MSKFFWIIYDNAPFLYFEMGFFSQLLCSRLLSWNWTGLDTVVLNSLVISLYVTENVQKLSTDKMNVTIANHADILKSRDLQDIMISKNTGL